MKRFISKYFFSFILCLIIIIIAVQNYVPGTYLTGWDNYQTDLNPILGIKRAFFSVWQEGQSFGLLAGMGHAADLVRAIFVFLLSLIFPQSAVRYVFHFTILFIGSFGMYHLLQLVSFHTEKKSIAFIGALFYLFNFGSIQIMFIPFESFSVMYGLLPWAVWIFLSVLKSHHVSKKQWLLFMLVNVLITPQGLSQQLFVVYGMFLSVLAIGYYVQHRQVNIIKNAFIVFVFILTINSFWVLPQIYFLKTSGYVVKEAKANQLHTINIFNQNLTKGNVKDFLLLRGFHYDLLDTGRNDGLFQEWKNHFQNLPVKIIVLAFAAIPLFGLFSKNKFHLGFVMGYGLIAIVLLLNTLPFSWINAWLRQDAFFSQVFRSPFTKFIIPYSLIISYLFAAGVDIIIQLLKRNHVLTQLFAGAIIISIFIYAYPAFYGYYFSPRLKVKIPMDYLEMINYFSRQDKNQRIALLPEYTFWGWIPYKWGYLGSGFLWYGIEQPIVARTFDVWSLESENYFWQIKYALEKEDVFYLEQVLKKYHITYLLVDNSLLSYGNNMKSLQYDKIEVMLQKSQKVVQIRKTEHLTLYEFLPTRNNQNGFISLSTELPNIGPEIKITNEDSAYLTYGDYQTDNSAGLQRYFPFLGLTSESRTKEPVWKIVDKGSEFLIGMSIGMNTNQLRYSALNPQLDQYQLLNSRGKLDSFILPIRIESSLNNVNVYFPKTLLHTIDIENAQIGNFNKLGMVNLIKNEASIIMKGEGFSQPNISYFIPDINQRYGYLVKTENIVEMGSRPYLNIDDLTKQTRIIEDKLKDDIEYHILPPRYQQGIGYAFTFYNYSYPDVATANEIQSLEIYAFPYNQLKQLELSDNSMIKKAVFNNTVEVNNEIYSVYKVDILAKSDQDRNLLLWQSYHPGWIAFSNGKILPHVKVNNWANGWKISDQKQITILFLPQFLEFEGFGIMILALIFILKYPSEAPRSVS